VHVDWTGRHVTKADKKEGKICESMHWIHHLISGFFVPAGIIPFPFPSVGCLACDFICAVLITLPDARAAVLNMRHPLPSHALDAREITDASYEKKPLNL